MMMFPQSRQMHTIEQMDFLSHQKMAERMLSPNQAQAVSAGQQVATSIELAAKRTRLDQNNGNNAADAAFLHLQPANFFPIDNASTVVVSKGEYEAIRQEVLTLKHSLTEFRSAVETEISGLKKENKHLRSQAVRCICGCRTTLSASKNSLRTDNDQGQKSSDEDDENHMHAAYALGHDKSLDDNGVSSVVRNLLDILSRENKNLQLQVQDLEKQNHQLRNAASRVPPIPSAQASTFLRELTAYYTILETNLDNSVLTNGSSLMLNGVKMPYHSLLTSPSVSLAQQHQEQVQGGSAQNVDIKSDPGGTGVSSTPFPPPMSPFDAHLFGAALTPACSIYGTMPEAFDVEKGLQVQLLPSYNVWVNKCKLQLLLKEATSLKEGAQLFVLRRLIPLVFSWEELATSRGQGLNCKSTDDVLSKDPLDPTKVLVCKAYMRKFCLETGHPEPTEKSINETFSHQVNYARRKFKRGKLADGTGVGGPSAHHHHSSHHHHVQEGHHTAPSDLDDDSYVGQNQCGGDSGPRLS